MGTLNFSLSGEEINQLIRKYGQANSLVNYASFCANVDHVFSADGDVKSAIDQYKSSAKFSASEEETLRELLNAIRVQVKD